MKKLYLLKKIKEKLTIKSQPKEIIITYDDRKLFLPMKNVYYLITKQYLLSPQIASKLTRKLRISLIPFLEGYCKVLDVIGLGFTVRFDLPKSRLRLNIGYNHSIYVKVPHNLSVSSKKRSIYVYGFDKHYISNFCQMITSFRSINPYKLKGIKDRYTLYKKKSKSVK